MYSIKEIYKRAVSTEGRSYRDGFDELSYVFEASIKLFTLAALGAVKSGNEDEVYRVSHKLLRADGIGTWVRELGSLLTGSTAIELDDEFSEYKREIIQKVSGEGWQRIALTDLDKAAKLLGLGDHKTPKKSSLQNIFIKFVFIRNKTRAHGAMLPESYEQPYKYFLEATLNLL